MSAKKSICSIFNDMVLLVDHVNVYPHKLRRVHVHGDGHIELLSAAAASRAVQGRMIHSG